MKKRSFASAIARLVFCWVFFVLFIGATGIGMAAAEDGHDHDHSTDVGNARLSVLEVSKDLVNPCESCGRVSLDQSPTCQTGAHYRALVAEQIRTGKTKQQILDYFADTYGEQMLGTPRPRGVNQFTTVIPFAAVLVSLLPLGLILSHRKKKATPGIAADRALSSTGEKTPVQEDPRIEAALRDSDF